jgi:hypothetical protein
MGRRMTQNLNLYTYNPADSGSTYVRDWINYISNFEHSNMTILDEAIGDIRTHGVAERTSVQGDGLSDEFIVHHSRGSLVFEAAVFKLMPDNSLVQIHPSASPVSSSTLKLKYSYPLRDGETHYVVIS